MSGLRMSAVITAATASGLVFLLLLGMLIVANVQSKALVSSYLTTLGSLIFIILSVFYDLLPIKSSFDTTAVVTYSPTTHKLGAEYYVLKTDPRIFIENAITDHVNMDMEISRSGIDTVARHFVIASTIGLFASEMGWWERTRSDSDGGTTAVNRWYGPDAKQISVEQMKDMLRSSGNVFSGFEQQIGTVYAPPGSRMSITENSLHIRSDYYSLSIDVGQPIGHDRLENGSIRLSLPLTISYKVARLRSQASNIGRYKDWLRQGDDKLRDWFAITD